MPYLFFVMLDLICLSRNAKTPAQKAIQFFKDSIFLILSIFSPTNIKNKMNEVQQMSPMEMFVGFFKIFFYMFYYAGYGVVEVMR